MHNRPMLVMIPYPTVYCREDRLVSQDIVTPTPRIVQSQKARKKSHQRMLVLALFVILTAALLPRPSNDKLIIKGFQIPELCILKRSIGVECPGCGLTRSFVSMAHFDWLKASTFNRVGPLFFLLVAAQIPYRSLVLRVPGLQLTSRKWSVSLPIIAALLVINWIVNFFI
jgi:hypothetical protein